MKKRKLLVTGTIVTTMLIGGASPTLAQTISTPKPLTQSYRDSEDTNDAAETGDIADAADGASETDETGYSTASRPGMAAFGLQADDWLSDSELEASSKEILIGEGISASQIHKLFSGSKTKNSISKMAPKNGKK